MMNERDTTSENREQELFFRAAKKNKIIIAIIGALIFFVGGIAPFLEGSSVAVSLVYPLYRYIYFSFLVLALILCFYSWKKQNDIIKNGLLDEKLIIQKMIEKVEEKISSNGEWEEYKYSFFNTILFGFFLGFIPVGSIFSHIFDWAYMDFKHDDFFGFSLAGFSFFSVCLFLICLFVLIFFGVFFVLRSYKKRVSKTRIEQKTLWGSRTILLDTVKDCKYNSGFIKNGIRGMTVEVMMDIGGKFFVLDILGTNGEQVEFYFSYPFGKSVEKIVKRGTAIFWVLEKIRKEKRRTIGEKEEVMS
jgi:uncharacterized membrane protein